MENENFELNELNLTEIQGNGYANLIEEINFDLYLNELSF